MKRFRILLPVIIILFLPVACKEKPKNPVAEYGDTLIDSYQRSRQTAEKANLDTLRKAVESYRASNGRLPENLEEMKEFIGSGIDTSKYDYNPENGAVSLKK
jgi:hypothetical protein